MAINGSALRAFSRPDFHSFSYKSAYLSAIGVRLVIRQIRYPLRLRFTVMVTLSALVLQHT